MRRIVAVCVVLTLLVLISGCDMEFYDDDEKILKRGDSHSASNVSQTATTYTLEGRVGKMTGMSTLWEFDATKSEVLEVDCGISIKKGRVKIVFISPEDEISVLVEQTQPGQDVGTKKISVEKGENKIKIVASDDAEFDFFLIVPKGEVEGIGD